VPRGRAVQFDERAAASVPILEYHNLAAIDLNVEFSVYPGEMALQA
jgi:hypothetical protein